MCGLLLDRMFRLHVQLTSHLVAIIGKQIVVQGFHISSYRATNTRSVGCKDSTYPPWIATLAGYLAFRGWGTALLSANSATGSISFAAQKTFLAIFSGKLFSTPVGQLNVICLVAGIVASVIVAAVNFITRANKIKKGYEADSMVSVVVKTVLSVAAIMLFAYKLAMSGGIPTVLVWVIVIVLIYVCCAGVFG